MRQRKMARLVAEGRVVHVDLDAGERATLAALQRELCMPSGASVLRFALRSLARDGIPTNARGELRGIPERHPFAERRMMLRIPEHERQRLDDLAALFGTTCARSIRYALRVLARREIPAPRRPQLTPAA